MTAWRSKDFHRRRELAGLDLGDVEDVVDEGEERARRGVHRRQHVALARVEAGAAQDGVEADHGVERGAELMAHDGEEAALGGVRLLGLRLRLGEVADERGQIGRQHHEREDEAAGERQVLVPERRGGDDGGEARHAHHGRLHQRLQPIAQSVADADPEIDAVPGRGGAAAEMQIDRQESQIGQHGEGTSQRQMAWPHHQVQQEDPAHRHADPHGEGRLGGAGVAGLEIHRRQRVVEHDADEDGADHDLLVLGIRPLGEIAGEGIEAAPERGDPAGDGAQRQRRHQRQAVHREERRLVPAPQDQRRGSPARRSRRRRGPGPRGRCAAAPSDPEVPAPVRSGARSRVHCPLIGYRGRLKARGRGPEHAPPPRASRLAAQSAPRGR